MFIEADKHRTDNINRTVVPNTSYVKFIASVVVLGVRYMFQSYFFILRSLRYILLINLVRSMI